MVNDYSHTDNNSTAVPRLMDRFDNCRSVPITRSVSNERCRMTRIFPLLVCAALVVCQFLPGCLTEDADDGAGTSTSTTGDEEEDCGFDSCSGSAEYGADYSFTCRGQSSTRSNSTGTCTTSTNGLGQITIMICTNNADMYRSFVCRPQYDQYGNPSSGTCVTDHPYSVCEWP